MTGIHVSGLKKSYGRVKVLDGIDLSVDGGTVLALLGPNGAGKTTMVRVLSTLVRPDAGEARVAGHDVVRDPDRVRRVISLTGQYAAVDEMLTGEENMLMMGRLCRLGRAESRRRSRDLLARFDLLDAGKRLVKMYSGGMRRRLDLAVSMVARPPVIFLDEPTTGLDPRSRQTMWDVIRQLVASGSTILLTTQYLEEADQLADRIALIDGGTVIAEGTSTELKARVGGERVELLFADDDHFDKARVDLDDSVVHLDRERRSIAVATDASAAQVRLLLNRMEHNAITVERMTLRQPTLDDVFLALTGHGTGGNA
jgi:ABC-2 type transport system ATP-binding protein